MSQHRVPVVTGPPRDVPPDPSVVTIGVFDGVHQGHRHLLREARAHAERHGLPLTVLTFHPHPLTVVRPELAPQLLATLRYRIELLASAGADLVRVVTFDAATAAMPAPDFVAKYLCGDLAAAAIVTGEGFRFGHRAAGDVALLREVGTHEGFEIVTVPLHGDVGAVWSSTRIRGLLGDGKVALAAEGLTRWHRVEGTVVRGAGRGRDLGYPTANVRVPAQMCKPADGVYAAHLVVDPATEHPQVLPAAVSVGANVTFAEEDPHVEAFVLEGGDWDLYDRTVGVDFVARIRDMERFDDVPALLVAMASDVAAARIITGAAAAPTG